jgi:putative membrane protein
MKQENAHLQGAEPSLPSLLPKALLGGMLMGLANLVPGVSGGTMLLAVGIYTVFIGAVADLTSLRFRGRSILVVAVVAGAAVLGILLLAGAIKDMVVANRWIAYSLFIGLTLGGVPVILHMIDRVYGSVRTGAIAGFAAMALVAALQQYGGAGGGGGGTAGGGEWVMLFVAGLAGASAMILPGISGGYLLLLLGQYIPILSAVDTLREALGAGDLAGVWNVGVAVILPVGLGLVAGVAVVSNVLKFLLARYRRATLGVLLGVLLGAVIGLWPFQQGVPPDPGEVFKGRVVTEKSLSGIPAEDYPTDFFAPTAGQVVVSLVMVAAGFGITYMISRLEPQKDSPGRGTGRGAGRSSG